MVEIMDNNETEVYKKINSAKSMKKHRSDLYIDEMQEIINKHG